MGEIEHICKSCGKSLGFQRVPDSTPNFGLNTSNLDNHTEKGIVYDPDCKDCNPHYWEVCPICNTQDINPSGKCRRCLKAKEKEGEIKCVK